MQKNKSSILRKNHLAKLHESLGATNIYWNEMVTPSRYSSNIHLEHLAIRVNAGLTDMSGIKKAWVSGQDSTEFLNNLVTRDCSKIEPGSAVYTALLDADGLLIDDAILFRLFPKTTMKNNSDWLICFGGGNGFESLHEAAKNTTVQVKLDENLVCSLLQGPKALKL